MTGPSQQTKKDSHAILRFAASPAKEIQSHMRRIERREWWLWSSAVMVTLLLLFGIASFAFPALLSQTDANYSFSINHSIRGLVGLVLIFNVYVVYQQLQINRIRRQVTDQVFAVDKVEELAEEVYKMAVLDPLTGLYNRRYIESRLAEEIARSRRNGNPLTAILFDLNGFKQVNDMFGHAAGDVLLKAFAERLAKSTRGSDQVARYGGDEFLAVLPECRPGEVQHILRRLDGFKLNMGEHGVRISFSAGWTDYVPGELAAEFLKRADAALYANKRAQKDQDLPVASAV